MSSMFTQPSPAPTSSGLGSTAEGGASAATSALPTSPAGRPSRLRGLNYLRNYAQSHRLSREHSNTSTGSQAWGSGGGPLALIRTTSDSSGAAPVRSTSDTSPAAAVAAAREGLNTTNSQFASPNEQEQSIRPNMTRSRAVTNPTDAVLGRNSTTTTTSAEATMGGQQHPDNLPSIRFSAYFDPRATRPSLSFSPVTRTLHTGSEVIRVGRYSERDTQPVVPVNTPSAAPVGFKSKVVSRRHCEFWFEGGKWFIKDVKSSSGTFLNHIRLSSPNTESRPYAVNDGDIVQLGIDFKGGEEMIFRCVKMRLELNRGWQTKLNTFNMNTHKRLRNMAANTGGSNAKSYSQDCSICLNSIAPCQCLFVAPCSHTWHYKCIRSLLASPSYPIFVCPNCRASADLEAEVEDPEEWEELGPMDLQDQNGAPTKPGESNNTDPAANRAQSAPPRRSRDLDRQNLAESLLRSSPVPPQPAAAQQENHEASDASDAMDVTMQFGDDSENQRVATPATSSTSQPPPQRPSLPAPAAMVSGHATTPPVPIPAMRSAGVRTPSPDGANGVALNGHEGPITPRNDAGPWVFDGSGVRLRGADMPAPTGGPTGPVVSLDAAATGSNDEEGA